MKALVVFASSVLLALPALAQSTSGGPAANGEGTADSNRTRTENRRADRGNSGDGEGRICRKLLVTGSNRPERVCLTREQWRAHGN